MSQPNATRPTAPHPGAPRPLPALPAPVSAARRAGRRWRTHLCIVAVAAAVVIVLTAVPDLPWRQGAAGAVLGAIALMVVLGLADQPTPALDGHLGAQWQRHDAGTPAAARTPLWRDLRAGIAEERAARRQDHRAVPRPGTAAVPAAAPARRGTTPAGG